MKTMVVLTALLGSLAAAVGAQETSGAATPATADTLPPAGVVETPYTIRSGDLELPGTLTMPAQASGAVPVALMVAGSGPTDRDTNGPLIRTNMAAQLAWALAERGIASVRYDKRSIPPVLMQLDLTRLTFQDFVDDVAAGARQLAEDERFSDVHLVGHSEGAGLTLLAANQGAPAASVVMMAGMGRPLLELMREQLAAQRDSVTMALFDTAAARLMRDEEPPAELDPLLRSLFTGPNRGFMRTAAEYDPTAVIRVVRVPVLIVQGEMDIQVRVKDAEALKAAQPAAELVIVPGANHAFKPAASLDPTSQLPLYRSPTIPIVPALVDTLAEWIRK